MEIQSVREEGAVGIVHLIVKSFQRDCVLSVTQRKKKFTDIYT